MPSLVQDAAGGAAEPDAVPSVQVQLIAPLASDDTEESVWVADADGNVAGDEKKFKDLYVSLNPKKTECVAGKAVVVRARADDFKTEADDGDSGEIVAVGVLKAV